MLKKKSILDVFTQISSEHEAAKPDLCIRLWNHVNQSMEKLPEKSEELDEEENEEKACNEFTYVLRRLIQGLGSPRAYVRKCYFATLVSILSHSERATFGPVTLEYFKSIVDRQLSKFESKGEEGEVLTGRILAYGVAFKSKVFLNSTVELQQEVLTDLLNKCKERSYLPLLGYTFVINFIQTVDENMFKTMVWPVLIHELLRDWPSQSFETLYCLLEVNNKYPQLLKKKMILGCLNTHTILHEDTIENVIKMLTNVTWEPRLQHPLYKTIGNLLSQEDHKELMIIFWNKMENVLSDSPTRIQQLAVVNMFSYIVENLNLDEIPQLLTLGFIDHLINCCKLTINKSDKLMTSAKKALSLVIEKATDKSKTSISSSVYKILCILMIDSGHLLIDKITGVKVVFPCIARLDAKHVKLLAKKIENIVLSSKKHKTENIPWNYKDRCYASQLLAKLISHPQSQDLDWKIKHLKVMLKYAIFIPCEDDEVHINSELAGVLKSSFFTALSHQLSHLENHRMVLISLVYYIDNTLTSGGHQLRNPLSDEVMSCWKETMKKIQKIDLKINESENRKTVMHVFHTMFLQMTLHLFVDADVAQDILKELDRCYKKEKTQFKSSKVSDSNKDDTEPKWIEIAVELFLSLLSRDTFLLRQLISRIFPHLCPYLTAQASFQILQVLDPSSGSNILVDENEESEEEESDEEAKPEMDVEDESDSEVEEDEIVEESAIEKTRQAVRDALGVAGSVTDTESIDLDDIDEEEGRRLDNALTDAFKKIQKSQNKNKKQSPNDKALTNFRIRVMDLVDIYLDNDPSLALVLDTIPLLFSLLEFCISDSHQKPLETRLRSTLKKIGNLKKCEKSEDAEEELLADILKNLIDKGVRTTSVFLDLSNEVSECCIFLLRMGVHIMCNKKKKKKKSTLFNVFSNAINNFFLKRDCLLPLSLFENILLKIIWDKNIQLCECILSCAFNDAVRGFRRNQGLSLLCCFFKNTRLLSILKENSDNNYVKLEENILDKTINALLSLKSEANQKLKPSFMLQLFLLLYTMKSSKFCAHCEKWQELGKLLQSFVNNGSFGLNLSGKYVSKLCSLLNVSIDRQKKSKRKRNEESESQPEKKMNGFVNDVASSEDESSAQNVKKQKKHKKWNVS